MSFFFLQCQNDQCRLRFPAAAEELAGFRCPRCRSAVAHGAAASAFTPAAEPAPSHRSNSRELVALLYFIRSIHNTGSMFRTADGAGLSQIYLGGITATPEHPRLAKAALGAHRTVPWTYYTNGIEAAQQLKCDGYQLWALERLEASAQPSLLSQTISGDRLVLVVGNEKAGVDPGILALCDHVISLPMVGRKTSLNAAVAFGIAIYTLRFAR